MYVSFILMDFLVVMIDNLKIIFCVFFIGNIIIIVFFSRFINLQIVFGNLLRDYKLIVNKLY